MADIRHDWLTDQNTGLMLCCDWFSKRHPTVLCSTLKNRSKWIQLIGNLCWQVSVVKRLFIYIHGQYGYGIQKNTSMGETVSSGHLWSFKKHSIRDMIQTGEDGTERDAREYVWVVSLTWIELLTIHFYHVKWTATRKHTPSLQTDAHWV